MHFCTVLDIVPMLMECKYFRFNRKKTPRALHPQELPNDLAFSGPDRCSFKIFTKLKFFFCVTDNFVQGGLTQV